HSVDVQEACESVHADMPAFGLAASHEQVPLNGARRRLRPAARDAGGGPAAALRRARPDGRGNGAGKGEERRSASERRAAASITAWACMRPGCRVRRSMGPETDTAATTRLEGPRTGAETDATPGSRSPIDCAQPRRRTPDSAVAVKRAPCR